MATEFSQTLTDGRAAFPALMDAVEAYLGECGVPAGTVGPVMVAVDEVISNALDHGGEPQVSVAVRVEGGEVRVEITDDGPAFDPTQAAAPDTEQSLEDREVGGLGVHLVRQMMDSVAYARIGDKNRLRFTKAYPQSSHSRQSPDRASSG